MKSTEKNEQSLSGFNPRQYRNMTIMFVILSLINVAFVFLAFNRVGFGLYYAEEALSHVSAVTQCVHSVNESAQSIVINNGNTTVVSQEIANIDAQFAVIQTEAEEFHTINLNNIDKDMPAEFDAAIQKTQTYQKALNSFTENLGADSTSRGGEIAATYSNVIEPLKEETEAAMIALLERQDAGTYGFFTRAAKQFLLVLLFLFLTLGVGVFGIARMKKTAKEAAEAIEEEHRKSQRLRAKTMDIAYTNILTGFKNFYGLENDIAEKVMTDKFGLALCSFNQYAQINEMHGRGSTDDFVTMVSRELTDVFGKDATIYSTAPNEFCFVFPEAADSNRMAEMAHQIVSILSRPYNVHNVTVQQPASCCYYFNIPGKQPGFDQMFRTLDKAMSFAKAKSTVTGGGNAIINADTLS